MDKSILGADMQEFILNLGKKIQYYRKRHGITLKQLAESIGTTPSLISQIERGKANPSLSTLKSIADVFDVPVGVMFENNVQKLTQSPIIRKNTHRKVVTQGNVHYSLLNPGSKDMEVILIEFPPGASTGDMMYRHEGYECGYLLKGELVVEIEDQRYIMEQGDSIQFDSPRHHKIINEGSTTAVTVWANMVPWIFIKE